MSSLALSAARVLTPTETISPGTVVVDTDGGTIEEVCSGRRRGLDLGERTLAPGFVDIHVHGGNGAQVNGADIDEVEESVARVSAFHAAHGTTSLLATAVTDSPGGLLATVKGVAAAIAKGERGRSGARIDGIHLEGPWIARTRAGAQDPAELRQPDRSELEGLIEASGGAVRLVTLAPELAGAFELIASARRAGVTVALGHSDADYETAERAFEAGVSHVAHLFNAMSPLHHRRPGVVGASLRRRDVTVELIADLEHVHPAVLEIVARLATDRVVAVSDAAPLAGIGSGRRLLGSLGVAVTGQRVTVADAPATLAGSMLTMECAVRNLTSFAGMTLEEGLRAASATPAGVISRPGATPTGCLAPSYPADLVCLEEDLAVAATVVAGRVVHDPGGLFS